MPWLWLTEYLLSLQLDSSLKCVLLGFFLLGFLLVVVVVYLVFLSLITVYSWVLHTLHRSTVSCPFACLYYSALPSWQCLEKDWKKSPVSPYLQSSLSNLDRFWEEKCCMPGAQEAILEVEREAVAFPGLTRILRYRADLWNKVAQELVPAGLGRGQTSHRPLSRAASVILDESLPWTKQ